MAIDVNFSFDENTYRHYMNGHLTVLHCHHYLSLTSKLAIDYDDIGGVKILTETVEDTMRPVFDDYIEKHGLASAAEILQMGIEYYSVMGLGKMEIDPAGRKTVKLLRSHVDKGWIKKWEFSDKAVNFFTCGYIAALYAAAGKKPARSYEVKEIKSIAMGEQEGVFEVGLVG